MKSDWRKSCGNELARVIRGEEIEKVYNIRDQKVKSTADREAATRSGGCLGLERLLLVGPLKQASGASPKIPARSAKSIALGHRERLC